MKQLILLFSILIFATSCEDVIDVDVPTTPPKLVIEASLINEFNENKFIPKVFVILSLTTPFFSEEPNFVTDATVTITNEKNNKIHNLIHTESGLYFLETRIQINSAGEFEENKDGENIIIEENINYKLTINYKGEVYESTENLRKSTPIDKLEQIKNENDFTPDDIAVEITYTERKERGNYYVFDFGEENFTAIDDEFVVNGKPFTFTTFYDEDVTKETRVKIIGSSKRQNNYFDAIQELSGGDTNGPFGSVPFKAKGNVVNKTNPKNFPFGYFSVSEVYFKDITLVDNSDFE